MFHEKEKQFELKNICTPFIPKSKLNKNLQELNEISV